MSISRRYSWLLLCQNCVFNFLFDVWFALITSNFTFIKSGSTLFDVFYCSAFDIDVGVLGGSFRSLVDPDFDVQFIYSRTLMVLSCSPNDQGYFSTKKKIVLTKRLAFLATSHPVPLTRTSPSSWTLILTFSLSLMARMYYRLLSSPITRPMKSFLMKNKLIMHDRFYIQCVFLGGPSNMATMEPPLGGRRNLIPYRSL